MNLHVIYKRLHIISLNLIGLAKAIHLFMLNKLKGYISKLDFQPAWLIFGIDVFMFFLAAAFVYLLQRYAKFSDLEVGYIPALQFVLTGIIALALSKSYDLVVRHTSSIGGLSLLKCMGIQVLILSACVYFDPLSYSWNGLVFNYYLLCSFLGLAFRITYRLLIRYIFFLSFKKKTTVKVGIFGAGALGVRMLDLLGENKLFHAEVLFFFDDNRKKVGKRINRIPVVDAADLHTYIKKYNLDQIIISPNDVSFERKEQLLQISNSTGATLKVLAREHSWFVDDHTTESLHDIDISDLLGREVIQVANDQITSLVKDRVILVTGAAGSIGSELCRQIFKEAPVKLILLDQAESALYELDLDLKKQNSCTTVIPVLCDISNERCLSQVFNLYKIDVIFHAAAYKHVPMQEQHPYEALKCNIYGTYLLANLAMANTVSKFIMVSTDKAVNPTNIMGATKRAAEIYIQACGASPVCRESIQFITTRFGNVLGSNGSVIPLFKKQIQSGGPVTVTHPDVIRYFMTISEACSLVLEAATMGKGGEIFVFDMGKPVKITDLAEKMIRLSGREPGRDIKIEFTGLRPGEKLYEELLKNEEIDLKTYHPKITIAQIDPLDYHDVSSQMAKIFKYMEESDEYQMVWQLKQLIPEFKSMHSRFCCLDHDLKGPVMSGPYFKQNSYLSAI